MPDYVYRQIIIEDQSVLNPNRVSERASFFNSAGEGIRS